MNLCAGNICRQFCGTHLLSNVNFISQFYRVYQWLPTYSALARLLIKGLHLNNFDIDVSVLRSIQG